MLGLQVYGRFLAQDQDSGRTSYFISRKTYLKITDVVSDYLRVSDTQVALIKGPSSSSIQGVGPGRTEIQVIFTAMFTLPFKLVESNVITGIRKEGTII